MPLPGRASRLSGPVGRVFAPGARVGIVGLACLLASRSVAAQTGPGRWRPDERVLVSDASVVAALARGPDVLFAATDGGLLLRRDAFGEWEIPITREDGYPLAPVTGLAADRGDGTVWLAAADGRLLQFDPFSRRFEDELRLGRAFDALMAGVPGDRVLFGRSGGRWWRIDPFSRDVRPATRAELEAAVNADPDLRQRQELLGDPGFSGSLVFLGGARASRARVTDVAVSADPGKYWLGTSGDFLVLYDRVMRDGVVVPWGILGEGAAAVAVGEDAVWIAPELPRQERYGVARADLALQTWSVWDADSAFSVPARGVRALVAERNVTWVGGDGGLWSMDRDGRWRQEARQAFGTAERVLSLAPAGGTGDGATEGVWIGTERGLYRLRAPGAGALTGVSSGRAILALHAGSDRLWIGSELGLASLALDAGEAARGPRPETGLPAAGVDALAGAGDTVFAAVGREVWMRDGDHPSWRAVESVGNVGAPVTALAYRAGVLWVGSAEGLLLWDATGPALRTYSFAAGDMPLGPHGERAVRSIAPESRSRAWIATPAGALRLDVDL